MKKQTVLSVLLVAAFLVVLPGTLSAQGMMDSPSPLDEDEGLSEDEMAMDDEYGADREVVEEAARDSADNRRTLNLPLEKKAKVVQKKLHPQELKHELNVWFGVNPADSFVVSIAEGLRYNFHINEMFGIQVVGGYMQNFDRDASGLLTDGVDNGGLAIEEDFIKNAEIKGFVNADFVFYPLYGKFALLSSWIAHYDMGIYIGAGAMFLGDDSVAPAPDVGIVGNIYLTKWLSLRGDFMYYAAIAKDKREMPSANEGANLQQGATATAGGNERGGTLLRNNYFITIGLSFHLPVD